MRYHSTPFLDIIGELPPPLPTTKRLMVVGGTKYEYQDIILVNIWTFKFNSTSIYGLDLE